MPTIVWSSAGRASLAGEITRIAGLDVIAAGGPGTAGAEVASRLGVEHCQDLRGALGASSGTVVLILSPGDFGALQDRDDAQHVLEAHKRGVRVLTLEPIPASAQEMTDARWDTTPLAAADVVRFVPTARATKSFAMALDALEHFGAVRAMSVESVCRDVQGSLGARLLGAVDLVQTLMGTPETVSASAVSPAQPRGFAAQDRDTLRGMTGDLGAKLGFADGRVATLFCSDQAGAWTRRVTVLGEGGRIEASDGNCRWVRPDGTVEEDQRADERPTAADVIGESITRVLTPNVSLPPTDPAATLAIAQAALLSTRTGQPESPESTLRMLRGV